MKWEADAGIIAHDLGLYGHTSGGAEGCLCIKSTGTMSGKCAELQACPALRRAREQPRGYSKPVRLSQKWNYLWKVVCFLL